MDTHIMGYFIASISSQAVLMHALSTSEGTIPFRFAERVPLISKLVGCEGFICTCRVIGEMWMIVRRWQQLGWRHQDFGPLMGKAPPAPVRAECISGMKHRGIPSLINQLPLLFQLNQTCVYFNPRSISRCFEYHKYLT